MYFWMLFPVPSVKHLLARVLQNPHSSCLGYRRVSLKCWVGHSLNDRTVNFVVFHCGHPKLYFRPKTLVSLECAGPHQHNGTSRIFIHCVVLEIHLFLIHTFQKVVALCFCELGPQLVAHNSRKNSCICRSSWRSIFVIRFSGLSLRFCGVTNYLWVPLGGVRSEFH